MAVWLMPWWQICKEKRGTKQHQPSWKKHITLKCISIPGSSLSFFNHSFLLFFNKKNHRSPNSHSQRPEWTIHVRKFNENSVIHKMKMKRKFKIQPWRFIRERQIAEQTAQSSCSLQSSSSNHNSHFKCFISAHSPANMPFNAEQRHKPNRRCSALTAVLAICEPDFVSTRLNFSSHFT